MKFCPIASGSSGNCIYAGSDSHSVLIDAGISGKRIEAGLGQIDRTGKDIDGILITHEHSDHIKGIGILARRYEMPVYMTQGTADALREITSVGKIPKDLIRVIKAGEDFEVGSLRVHPFTVSHDAAEPVGFRLKHTGDGWTLETDLWQRLPAVRCRMVDSDVLGCAFESGQRYEAPDGSFLRLDTDLFGQTHKKPPLPGPLSTAPEQGRIRLS